MKNTIKLYLIFSHTLTAEQEQDAIERFGIEEIVQLPEALLALWSHIPAENRTVKPYIKEILMHLGTLTKNDYVLVQGDFGATYIVVDFVKEKGATAIYATTQRNVIEKKEDNQSIKTSIFKHVRYRVYGE